ANIPSTKSIVYFPAGVYSLGGRWVIPATVTHVYIAGGAYVKGYLYRNVQNQNFYSKIMINGRGIISNEGFPFHYPATATDQNASHMYTPISLYGGPGSTLEGLTFIEASYFNVCTVVDNMTINNVKINGFRYNNDAISVVGSGITISNCFMRDNDDSIVPYGNNITITGCVFWQLQGSVIQLGWTPHSMSNLTISNSIVLHDKSPTATWASEGDCGFISAMNKYTTTASADINNFTITNIVFDTPVLRFMDIRGDRNGKSTAYPIPWVFRNFKVTNIWFNGGGTATYPLNYLHGYDINHPLVGFTFQNIYIKGAMVSPTSLLTHAIAIVDNTILNKINISQ
ncbi:MAG: hypothetical protein ABI166_05650, partial [Mucilaginibacter sp.]